MRNSLKIANGMALALVLSGAVGCGSDEPGLYITMWSGAFSSLVVGQEAKLSVQLSQVPTGKVYVDVENSYPDLATVDPMTIPFQDVAKKDVTVKGNNPGKATLVFKLRENGATRNFSFEVVNQPSFDAGVP